jgi:hypothetical protein
MHIATLILIYVPLQITKKTLLQALQVIQVIQVIQTLQMMQMLQTTTSTRQAFYDIMPKNKSYFSNGF